MLCKTLKIKKMTTSTFFVKVVVFVKPKVHSSTFARFESQIM